MDSREFRELLRAMIPADDSPFVVYSGLWLFARLFPIPVRQVPDLIIESLIEVAGPHRTIVMPTYTSGFQDGIIDLDNQPSQTGVITEAFRQRPDTYRTASSFFSFAAWGPEARQLSQRRPTDVWGEGSVFEWMQQRNAHIIVLGESCETISLTHRTEWLCRVPYRYYKTFSGTMVYRGKQDPLSERLFVRSLDPEVINVWHNLEEILYSAGMKAAPLGGGKLTTIRTQAMINALVKSLEKDPFCFTHDPNSVRHFVFDHSAKP